MCSSSLVGEEEVEVGVAGGVGREAGTRVKRMGVSVGREGSGFWVCDLRVDCLRLERLVSMRRGGLAVRAVRVSRAWSSAWRT